MRLSVAITHAFPGFGLDVAFEAPPGVTALFGRSGAGKTTVINAVAGLFRPDRARIALDDLVLEDSAARRRLPTHRRRLGYVFQQPRLFPHLSVRANLLYGAADDRELGRITGLLGITHLLSRRPMALSGGEAQRVALGRALLAGPSLLLMDEPLAALDAPLRAEILPYLERLRDVAGIPILYVSHSASEVARLATTVVVLDQGRVAASGPAAQVFADPALAPLFGPREAGAILPARVIRHHADGLSELAIAGGRLFLPRVALAEGATLRLRILARDVTISLARPEGTSALNILPATITAIHPGDGPGAMVQLACAGDMILARITQRSVAALRLAPGTQCHAVLKSVATASEDVGGGPDPE